MTQPERARRYNFSAGPACLPLSVLEQAQQDLLCLPECGASVMEISHRSATFKGILASATSRLQRLLNIPDDYEVFFLQGGSRLQFSMVPMNLLGGQSGPGEYILGGSWGIKAYEEGQSSGKVHAAFDGKSIDYVRLPRSRELSMSDDAAFLHFTSNETIHGTQYAEPPIVGQVPLVCDASSDFLSRPLQVSDYGLIYACAQKNAGPAGVTVVIIRRDLLSRSADTLPGYLNYRLHVEQGSLYNTPPTFAIYIMDLILAWLEEKGGLSSLAEQNQEKANWLYTAIDASNGFYDGHADLDHRSLMNVTFRLPDDELRQKFLAGAAKRQMDSLAGHRSVGGIRASIYNAMPPAGVECLAQFMDDFRKQST